MELKITFRPDGSVHKEVFGAVGKECESLTKFIEDTLGGKDMRRVRKEAYFAENRTKAENRTRVVTDTKISF